jgi:hypothetical protein
MADRNEGNRTGKRPGRKPENDLESVFFCRVLGSVSREIKKDQEKREPKRLNLNLDLADRSGWHQHVVRIGAKE